MMYVPVKMWFLVNGYGEEPALPLLRNHSQDTRLIKSLRDQEEPEGFLPSA
jgi:hypothetical protein